MFSRVPYLIAICYAVVGAVWIVLSDWLLSAKADGYSHYQLLQTYKGWAFVAASALLIFVLLRSAWTGLFATYEESRESEHRLHLALTSAGGGIWELDLTGGPDSIVHVSDELVRRLGLPPGHQLTMAEFRDRRHPDDNEEADRKLARAIASGGKETYDVRYRVRCEDGRYRWAQIRGNVIAADGKPQRMIGVALDIDDQVRAEQRIAQLLRYDPVTGLPRPGKFILDLDAVLATSPPDTWVALVQLRLLDLDRLIGDAETIEDAALILSMADRLHRLSSLLICRVASDVFALATPPAPSAVAAQGFVRDALTMLLEPLRAGDGPVKLRIQAGGALGLCGGDSAVALLRTSGHALELASRTTEIEVRWFNEELGAEYAGRTDRIRGLQRAVADGEIECYYQPLVDLRTGRTAGFEALARWHRKDHGIVLPEQFIGLAEEEGKIAEIGEEVLMQACRTAAEWPSPFPFVAVNVSPLQLEDPTFPGIVARVLRKTGLSPERLELEITESALPRDDVLALQRILALRDLGVLIAIDDFGTGYSSLSLLNRIPFTRLKIDRSFISGSGSSHEHMIIVDTIITLAHSLGLATTAEGVETFDQAAMLAAKGVELAQGYHFSTPVPAAEVSGLVARSWEPVASTAAASGLRLVR